MSLKEDVIALVEASDAAITLARSDLEKQAAAAAEISKQAPDIAQLLVDGGWVPVEHKEAAASALQDPVNILKLLKLALTQTPPGLARPMGQAVSSPKQASVAAPAAAPRRNPNFIGQRTGEPTEADRVIFERMGLPVPTGQY
jgi:hypothetical protein